VRTLTGVGSTPLSGVGTAHWHRPEASLTLPDRPDPSAVDVDAELARFENARDAAREAIRSARDRAAERVGEEEAAVFEAHEQFLDDPELVEDIEAAIESGTPAEHAVSDRFAAAIEQFEALDGKMAERADDLRDVRDRLLRILLNTDAATDLGDLPAGTVVLAERLTPSDTAELDPDGVAGIATVAGGRTAHAAIIARSLSIPATPSGSSSAVSLARSRTAPNCSSTERTDESSSTPTRRPAKEPTRMRRRRCPSASRPPTADRLKWRRTSEARRRSLRPPSAAPTGSGCSGRSSSFTTARPLRPKRSSTRP